MYLYEEYTRWNRGDNLDKVDHWYGSLLKINDGEKLKRNLRRVLTM